MKPQLSRYALFAILLGSLALNTAEISWGLPAPDGRGWDIDTIAPTLPLSAASGLFTHLRDSFYPAYPLFHYMITALCYSPYVIFLLLTGQIDLPVQSSFPYGIRDPERVLNNLILISRLLSAVMATALVATWYRIAKLSFGVTAGLYTAITTATGFTFIYFAHTGNLDVPYLFWTSLALEQMVRIQYSVGTRPYLWLGVFAALAVATKDQAYGFFILPFAWLVYERWRAGTPGQLQTLLRDRPARQLLAGFGVTYAVASNLILNPQFFARHLHNVVFQSKYGSVYQDFIGQRLRLMQDLFWALVHGYGVWFIGIPLVLLGVFALVQYRKEMRLLIASIVSYFIFFLFVVGYSFDRFALGIVFVLNVALAALLARWSRSQPALSKPVLAFGAALLATSAAHLPRLLKHDSRYAVEQYLAANRSSSDTILLVADGAQGFSPRVRSGPGVETVSFEQWNLSHPSHEALPTANLVVLSCLFDPPFGGENLLSVLRTSTSGYSLVLESKARFLLAPDSLVYPNPKVYVFRRS